MKRKYTGIEILRVICACLIPLLHISFLTPGMYYLQQYIARLGVPFFFSISGLFLSQSIKQRTEKIAWERYAKKISRLLIVWLVIYTPLLIVLGDFSIKEILFRTPAFLWYLGSMLIASIPFCFVKNRKVLYVAALLLYVIGTLFGDTYRWLLGGMPVYERIFITTRNGIFFALPMMLVGEIVNKSKKTTLVFPMILSTILLAAEISVVGIHIQPGCDRSMYLMMPLFIYFALQAIKGWNPSIDITFLGGISSAIYLMQYGLINVMTVAFNRILSTGELTSWAVYSQVIIIPIIFYMIIKDTKVKRILF